VNGCERIAAERQRQIDKEGYDATHDDGHDGHEIAFAALAYISLAVNRAVFVMREGQGFIQFIDPWAETGWSPMDREPTQIDALVKAGALIAAEIDRLLRASPLPADPKEPR
jgi:hypothetical protein